MLALPSPGVTGKHKAEPFVDDAFEGVPHLLSLLLQYYYKATNARVTTVSFSLSLR